VIRDDVTVTPEEMAQAIENAQTAVFRDPPWSPNARAFLALLADRDALRAELERTKEELEIARAELTHQRDGYDHEPDEHAHGGSCRACKSEAALENMDAASAAIERKDGA
jgi:hypothetical protein